MVKDHLLTWVQFGTPAPDLHLYLDASCSGWGAHLLDQHVSGVWSNQEKLLHINLLEMKALFLSLQSFREVGIGHHVTAMCDNSTVVAYVNKRGGTVSLALCSLASCLLDGPRVSTTISMRGIFQDKSMSWQISSAVAGK